MKKIFFLLLFLVPNRSKQGIILLVRMIPTKQSSIGWSLQTILVVFPLLHHVAGTLVDADPSTFAVADKVTVRLVADLTPGPAGTNPNHLVAFANSQKLLFTNQDDQGFDQLWVVHLQDDEATPDIRILLGGPNDNDNYKILEVTLIPPATPDSPVVYMRIRKQPVTDEPRRLYRTDGFTVKPVGGDYGVYEPGDEHFLPTDPTTMIYTARATISTSTFDLFKTNGETVTLVKDFFPDEPDRDIYVSRIMAVVGDRLVMALDYDTLNKDGYYVRRNLYELWTTNGTPEGTFRLGEDVDLTYFGTTGNRRVPNEYTDRLLFTASTDNGLTKGLWLTKDGETVSLVTSDVVLEAQSPHYFKSDGRTLFSSNFQDIWISDATEEGTFLIFETTEYGLFGITGIIHGTMYIFMQQGSGPYISDDGDTVLYTFSEGESEIKFLKPVMEQGRPHTLQALPDGRSLFSVGNDLGKRELWILDGSDAYPIASFPSDGGRPRDYFSHQVFGSNNNTEISLYVRAYSHTTGFELFQVTFPAFVQGDEETDAPSMNATVTPSTTVSSAATIEKNLCRLSLVGVLGAVFLFLGIY